MNITEVKSALKRIKSPSFVRSVEAFDFGFNESPDVQREYRLFVQLTGSEHDPYPDPDTRGRTTRINAPLSLPANEDELRAQVTAAIVMATAHETIEQVSEGGKYFCAPHGFKGGSQLDTFQWLTLLDTFHNVVRQYATYMPVKTDERCPAQP